MAVKSLLHSFLSSHGKDKNEGWENLGGNVIICKDAIWYLVLSSFYRISKPAYLFSASLQLVMLEGLLFVNTLKHWSLWTSTTWPGWFTHADPVLNGLVIFGVALTNRVLASVLPTVNNTVRGHPHRQLFSEDTTKISLAFKAVDMWEHDTLLLRTRDELIAIQCEFPS